MDRHPFERGSAVKSVVLALGALIVVIGASYVFFSNFYAPVPAALPILNTAQQQSQSQQQTPAQHEQTLEAIASSSAQASASASSSATTSPMTSEQKQALLQSFQQH